jgi:HAD domain family 1 in Swiss Army Knife RNA repair proteins
VKRIVDSKGLDFDLACLKPEVGPNGEYFKTTSEFKNEFLKNLVFTYRQADEIRIYEDRPKHVKFFRDYFEKLNKSLLSHPIDQPPPPRKPITADVIQVAELNSYLDPVVEASTIQSIINKHNAAVTKGLPRLPNSPLGRKRITSSYIYFGYLIKPTDSSRLITLANIQPPTLIDSSDIRLMANSILIAPRPPDRQTLEKVGGRSKKLTWQVTGTAVFENKIWAVRVGPVPETERYWTNDPVPIVVLAVRKGARPIDAGRIQNWQPVPPERAFIFETVVGDKQILRVEAEDSGDERYEPRTSHRGNFHNGFFGNGGGVGHGMKRKFGGENGGYHGGKDTGGHLSRIEDRDMNVGGRDDGTWMPQDRAPGHSNGNNGGRHGGRGGGQFHNGNKQNDNDGRRYFSMNRGGGGPGGGGGGNQSGRGGGAGGRGGGGGSNNNNNRRNDYSNSSAQGGGNRGRGNDRRDRGGGGGGGGGGGRGRIGNRGGPAGYKSLDDYGPAGYDGSNDYRGSGGGTGDGQVVMNY